MKHNLKCRNFLRKRLKKWTDDLRQEVRDSRSLRIGKDSILPPALGEALSEEL